MPASLTVSNAGGPPPFNPDLPGFGGGGGGGDDGRREPGGDRKTSLTGIVVLMCASIMTFGSFLSAMIIRRGLGTEWGQTPIPTLLYWNTGLLLASSFVLDYARRILRRGKRQQFNWVWTFGTVMGIGFIVGQFIAWNQLTRNGFTVTSSPSSSFFYVVTWAHAAHAIGAMSALLYIAYRALRFQLGPKRRTVVDVATVFWHFLDFLWLAIMALYRYWA